jgi:hypothetical protein
MDFEGPSEEAGHEGRFELESGLISSAKPGVAG